MQIDKSLMPAVVFGGLIAVGLIGAGAFIGQGVVNARVGDRQVTVRGVAERNVQADLAVLSLGFTGAGESLPGVQAKIDRDLGLVRAFIGQGVVNARVGDRQVTVRGVAERNVQADLAVLSLRFTGAGESLPGVQAKIDRDLGLVRAFLDRQGYPADAVTVGRLEVTDTKAREYVSPDGTPHYILAQSVVVRTNDVKRVSQTERALNDLVREGVVLDFTAPTYVFSKLNEVRPSMIAEATASARTGAEQFAKDSGAPLGPISRATQGSFEILAREDVDAEATSLDKRVRVVTTVSYRLR